MGSSTGSLLVEHDDGVRVARRSSENVIGRRVDVLHVTIGDQLGFLTRHNQRLGTFTREENSHAGPTP